MTATLRIPVQESLLEILKGLGSLEIVTAAALRRYALDRCLQRIEQAERQIAFYERRYESDYNTFNRRTCTDQAFLDLINRDHPMWEADAIEWAYRIEEAQAWRERLERILRESWPSLAPS
ncbi:MAG: hypothetical protein ISS50_09115 [Anaerolineae bacterium]|nr:hypothetical protein [Anaerolineae bacterium]